jgi:hypothetical protein
MTQIGTFADKFNYGNGYSAAAAFQGPNHSAALKRQAGVFRQ